VRSDGSSVFDGPQNLAPLAAHNHAILAYKPTALTPMLLSTLVMQVLQGPNGLDTAAAINKIIDDSKSVATDFRRRPFIAMLSNFTQDLTQLSMAAMKFDGSGRGCDAFISSPLNIDALGVLLEGCCL